MYSVSMHEGMGASVQRRCLWCPPFTHVRVPARSYSALHACACAGMRIHADSTRPKAEGNIHACVCLHFPISNHLSVANLPHALRPMDPSLETLALRKTRLPVPKVTSTQGPCVEDCMLASSLLLLHLARVVPCLLLARVAGALPLQDW